MEHRPGTRHDFKWAEMALVRGLTTAGDHADGHSACRDRCGLWTIKGAGMGGRSGRVVHAHRRTYDVNNDVELDEFAIYPVVFECSFPDVSTIGNPVKVASDEG